MIPVHLYVESSFISNDLTLWNLFDVEQKTDNLVTVIPRQSWRLCCSCVNSWLNLHSAHTRSHRPNLPPASFTALFLGKCFFRSDYEASCDWYSLHAVIVLLFINHVDVLSKWPRRSHGGKKKEASFILESNIIMINYWSRDKPCLGGCADLGQ